MLLIDLHTLETIYALYLIDNILLHSGWTLDGKDITRSDDTVRERSTGTHSVMLLYKNLL